MNPKLGLTRNVIKRNYALITPDGHVPGVFPGWTDCTPYVLISAALGAGLSQYLISLDVKSVGAGETGNEEWFLYIVAGKAKVNGASLSEGGFAFLPSQTKYEIRGAGKNSRLLVFRKTYEPLAGHTAPKFFSGNERDITETPFLGDKHARLKTLIPDGLAADMAVNIFTYDPGATLPFVETHVMEHGMLFLSGGGVYRLDADWHPVTAGDAIWIGPYCPQWFIAAGPEPARYIYYKDVNRLPR
ncbi:MAG TPA: (S)-ureidoglycine aminohydrolase [Verrucomicrobiae bacterium]|jgi:(S)-ureidoglycine aminohydrolase|nr:(S)-ureidoglycine aminohydrolase [Verrucomicrobiae bacterium]